MKAATNTYGAQAVAASYNTGGRIPSDTDLDRKAISDYSANQLHDRVRDLTYFHYRPHSFFARATARIKDGVILDDSAMLEPKESYQFQTNLAFWRVA